MQYKIDPVLETSGNQQKFVKSTAHACTACGQQSHIAWKLGLSTAT